jgi:hypothetical protein
MSQIKFYCLQNTHCGLFCLQGGETEREMEIEQRKEERL